jgi:pimeloyl-ACP methyl ester carboxylesterase
LTALVLLPGLDGTGELFADFVAALGSDVEVIVVSYPRDQAQGYSELEDIARSLLPTDQPYLLLAESFSGPIGISIAASRPPGMIGLVLCCTFAKLPFPFGKWMQHVAGIAPVAMIPQSSLDLVLLGRHMTRALRERFAETLSSVAPEVLRRRAQEALLIDRTPQLASIRVPVLCLHASEDQLISARATKQLADRIANSSVIAFDAPHFLLQVRPLESAAAVRHFATESSRDQRA